MQPQWNCEHTLARQGGIVVDRPSVRCQPSLRGFVRRASAAILHPRPRPVWECPVLSAVARVACLVSCVTTHVTTQPTTQEFLMTSIPRHSSRAGSNERDVTRQHHTQSKHTKKKMRHGQTVRKDISERISPKSRSPALPALGDRGSRHGAANAALARRLAGAAARHDL